MTSNQITNNLRFLTSSSPCPICGGYANMRHGIGERCAGFRSEDGQYALCTREDYASNLDITDASPPGYMHKLTGSCDCGKQHGAVIHQFPTQKASKKTENSPIVAEYTYRNEQGRIAYQVQRCANKDFKQRRPDPQTGKWLYSLTGVPRLPYCLPELRASSKDAPVYLPEGEKDVDTLRSKGFIASTNSGGALNWQENLNQYFRGRHVVILPDNDEKGQLHADKVVKELTGIASSIKVLALPDLPEKGDVSDWFAAGGTPEQLEALTAATSPCYQEPKRRFLYASQVQPEPVHWLWQDRLAKGMLTLLVGDPGLGKSMLTTALTAAVTTGGVMPDSKAIRAGGVIIMAPEDSYQHTIVPRLLAAGADLTKVILLSEVEEFGDDGQSYMRPIMFPEDAPILEEAIVECGASLAIIDPVLGMINGKYDTHKDQQVRLALGRIISVAARHECALLGIVHLSKGQSGNALYRSGASIAFMAQARLGLFLIPDPDNPENGRVIVNHKNNLVPKSKKHLRFTIEQDEKKRGYVQWHEASPYTEDELLCQNTAATTATIPSPERQAIVNLLKQNPNGLTARQIAEKLGKNYNTLRNLLTSLRHDGIISLANTLYVIADPIVNRSQMDEEDEIEEEGREEAADTTEQPKQATQKVMTTIDYGLLRQGKSKNDRGLLTTCSQCSNPARYYGSGSTPYCAKCWEEYKTQQE